MRFVEDTEESKKEYKEFYLPGKKPQLVEIPKMNYIAVRGKGNPNEDGGAYKESIGLLYGIAFTIKMSKKGSHEIQGYFDYVVPPLEGLWWQEGTLGVDYTRKADFQWISLIRLPEFVTREAFDWAVREAAQKKGQDFSPVEFFSWEEGLCVQCMHLGPYDDEPATVRAMEEYARARSDKCPFMEEKTFCSNCKVHCYKPEMREKIRQVMAFAGPRMLFVHPGAAIRHVIETKREQKRLERK